MAIKYVVCLLLDWVLKTDILSLHEVGRLRLWHAVLLHEWLSRAADIDICCHVVDVEVWAWSKRVGTGNHWDIIHHGLEVRDRCGGDVGIIHVHIGRHRCRIGHIWLVHQHPLIHGSDFNGNICET